MTATIDVSRRPCILVADDDPGLLEIVTALLTESGYDAVGASTGAEAIARLREANVDIVLTDILMPDATGIDVLRAVRERHLDTPVILMTGNPTVPTAVEALALGALGYLVKPVLEAKLLETVSEALGLVRLTRLRRQAVAELGSGDRFIGDRAGLEAVFGRAREGLWVAYQPVIWARDGTCFGHEALLRTTAPDVPNPVAFLDIAERLERIPELGRQVRERVAGDLDTMAGAALINLHPLELAYAGLGAEEDPLARHAHRVVFEITERASLDDVGDVRELVRQLRSRGFRIAVDDLGAGYAALSSFASLEPDIVKLDMSLVRDVDHHQTRRRLIASITELCRDLGILVVAEGIETEAERDVLLELGCDLLQGFLLGRPAPRRAA
jgi:EAL domain-containing protein (putative c-di-GMP-specific phosphodiesterase class I)